MSIDDKCHLERTDLGMTIRTVARISAGSISQRIREQYRTQIVKEILGTAQYADAQNYIDIYDNRFKELVEYKSG